MRETYGRSNTSAAEVLSDRDATRYLPLGSRPVEVHILGRNSLDILTARDISMTGLGVYVPHRFVGCGIDSEVELVITLPGQRTFVAKGQVKHQTGSPDGPPFFGVQFTSLKPEHRERIRAYLTSNLVRRLR